MRFLQHSYNPNYFSIEDILLQDVRVSCKVEVNVPKLGMNKTNEKVMILWLNLVKFSGMLDASSDCVDLKQGSKVELPFWMVPTLHSKKVVTFEVPRHYKVNYRYPLMVIFSFFFLAHYSFLDNQGKSSRRTALWLISTSGAPISTIWAFT